MQQYTYNGPICIFGRCVESHWKGTTYAISEKKARSNLIYQYKKQTGKTPAAKVELPGKITLVE